MKDTNLAIRFSLVGFSGVCLLFTRYCLRDVEKSQINEIESKRTLNDQQLESWFLKHDSLFSRFFFYSTLFGFFSCVCVLNRVCI